MMNFSQAYSLGSKRENTKIKKPTIVMSAIQGEYIQNFKGVVKTTYYAPCKICNATAFNWFDCINTLADACCSI